MKVKNFMKKFAALALGLGMTLGVATGLGNRAHEVDADNYTLFYTNNCPKSSSNSSYANNYDATIEGIKWNAPGNQYENGAWRIGGKVKETYDRTLYTKTSIDAEIGKIDFVTGTSSLKSLNSIVLDVYSTAADAASGSASNKISSVSQALTASSTISFVHPASDGKWSNAYYRFTLNVTGSSTSAQFLLLSKIDFFKDNSEPEPELVSVEVSGSPSKNAYNAGEELDPKGLVVTAKYAGGSTKEITSGISWAFDPATLSAGDTSCNVVATVQGVSSEAYEVTGLTVTSPSYKNTTELKEGKYFIYYDDGTNNNYLKSVASGKGATSTDISDALEFTFKLVGDDLWTIKNDSNYLGIGNSSTSLKLENSECTLAIGWDNQTSNTRKIGGNLTGGRYIAWYSSGLDFRTYTSGTLSISLKPAVIHNITIDGDSSVALGDTLKLNGVCDKSDTISWKSSDETTATVSSTGLVTGLKIGNVTITASCDGEGKATKEITVSSNTFSISPSSFSGKVGASTTFTANLSTEITGTTYSWSASGDGVLELTNTASKTVSVLLKKAGTVSLSCVAMSNGVRFEESVSVSSTSSDPLVEWVQNKHPSEGFTGVEYEFAATQQNIENPVWSWAVSPSIGEISSSESSKKLTFTEVGKYTVTATCKNSLDETKSDSCSQEIEIKESTIELSLNHDSGTVEVNNTISIIPTISATGSYSDEATISVSSADPSSVTVNNAGTTSTTSGVAVSIKGLKKTSEPVLVTFTVNGAEPKNCSVSVVNFITDLIALSDLGISGSGYVGFSGVKKNSDASYSGMANNPVTNIFAFRSSDNTSGIVSTTSGGHIKKVIVDFTGCTKDRKLDVYGKNSPYTGSADLFDSTKQGTKIGSIVFSSTGTPTQVELDCTENGNNFEYVGIRSNNGSVQIKTISFVWEPVTFGELDHIEIVNPGRTLYTVGDKYSYDNIAISKVDTDGNKLLIPVEDLDFSIEENYEFLASDVPSKVNTVSYQDVDPVDIEITVSPISKHVKVTSEKSDWSGKYIIASTVSAITYALDSSLLTADQDGNNQIVVLSNDTIDCGTYLEVEIAEMSEDIYSIQLNSGKYIGATTGSDNSMGVSSTPIGNKISINDGNLVISSSSYSGYSLQFNSGTSLRFRYYGNGKQTPVSLYEYQYEMSKEVEDWSNSILNDIEYDGKSAPSLEEWSDVKEYYFDDCILGEDLFYLRNITGNAQGNVAEQAVAKYDEIVSMFNYSNYVGRNVELHEYSIKWNNYDDSLIKEDKLVYGATPEYKGDEPTRSADERYTYSFNGWDKEIVDVTCDATYTAQYLATAIEYTITYHDSIGDPVSNPTSYTCETDTITLINPSKAGYRFLGWFDAKGNKVTEIVKGTTGNIALTASWESITNMSVSTEANFKATSKDGQVEKIDSTSLRMYLDISTEYFNALEKDGYDFRIKITLDPEGLNKEAYLDDFIERVNGATVRLDTALAIPTEFWNYDIVIELEAYKEGDTPQSTNSVTVSYMDTAIQLKKDLEEHKIELSDLQVQALEMILASGK